MPVARIHDLTSFDAEEFRRIAPGYTSDAKYAVLRHEAEERVSIELVRVPLDDPHVKVWDWADEDTARYREVVAQGFSIGATDGGNLVGLALAEPREWHRDLWVHEIHVAEKHRGQGIGAQLVARLTEKATGASLRSLVFETQSTNAPAIDFYRAVGCELEGIDLSFYTNTDVDDGEVALFMKKKLAT